MQVTVPAKHRVGPHQQPQTVQAWSGQLVQQRRQPGPIGRLEPDPMPAELAVQHRELVPQGEDLRISKCRRPVLSSRSAFAGFRFPPDVIMVAVQLYLRYNLSYRDVEELLIERGAEVDRIGLSATLTTPAQ